MIDEQKPTGHGALMADLAPMQTDRTITAMDYDARGVTLDWDDGRRSRFHALWLRDNCGCHVCRHPQALERTFMFIDHATPTVVSASLGIGDALEVRFQAGERTHVSRYPRGWLRAHEPAEIAAAARQAAPLLWDEAMSRKLPSIDYANYMQTSAGLRQWILALKTHGIVLLRDVPCESGKLLEVARRVGPVRASNFGDYYDVVSMPDPNASAYTPMGLELHTDLANWRTPPDVQLLFCLKNNAIGGESVFADGFRVAEDLRAADPQAFYLLTTQPIEYRFHDESCDIRASATVIEVDEGGRLIRIRFNNWLRGTTAMSEGLVEPLYGAIGRFWRMLRDPQYRLNWRLEPGCLIAYDNNRVLHGRQPYDATSGERHLQGCYLNREDVDSALRLLERRPG